MTEYDLIIVGAGAAGMMCGAVAGRNGARKILLIDQAVSPAEKIRISGGGKCNFTNIYSRPENFISDNRHFCKSALAGYTPQDFIALVESHGIRWHEKNPKQKTGQLFCDESANQIIGMLRTECKKSGNEFRTGTSILDIAKKDDGFWVTTEKASFKTRAVVMACGGPSIPKIGGTRYGYKIAEQFGLRVVEPRPALVPLTFTDGLKQALQSLSGVSVAARVSIKRKNKDVASFTDALLFTHRGLSGPSILQISSYWQAGEALHIDLAPGQDVGAALSRARTQSPKQSPAVFLGQYLPKPLAQYKTASLGTKRLADLNAGEITALVDGVHHWQIKPAGSEGYRKAEVSCGGVDTRDLSSKTLEARTVPGLYFIGEVVDVTGHLGGHNFQWAWASAVACGRALRKFSA